MPTMTTPTITVPHPPPLAKFPDLTWVTGTIEQILLQDKEHFYVVTVNTGKDTVICRFGDPYTGKCGVLTTADPMYALIQEAYFHNQTIELGVRDWGYDKQSGIENKIIDRVSVHHT